MCASSVQPQEVTIATVSDGPLAREFTDFSIIEQEIRTIVGDEFKIIFPANLQVNGDWTEVGIQQQLQTVLNNKDANIVITMGVVSSHLAAQIPDLSKPAIAPYVVDVALQNMPYKDNSSGKNNFVYTHYVSSVSDDLKRFYRLVNFNHLAVLVNELPVTVIPSLENTVNRIVADYGFDITLVMGKSDIQQIVNSIPAKADAVLVASLLRVNQDDIHTLENDLIKRKLPSFSFLGQQELNLGLMATISGRASDQVVFARRIATNIYRLLLGTPAA